MSAPPSARNHRENDSCIVCGSNSRSLLFRTRDRHYGIPGEFEIFRCDACSLVHLFPMPTEQELISFYPEDYYAYQEVARKKPWKQFVKKLIGYNIHTNDPHFSRAGRVLDVGCGSGEFLLEMRKKGWDVYGVEPKVLGANIGHRTAGIHIAQGTLPCATAMFPDGMFDYVRSNHSFEHIRDPSTALAEMKRLLSPVGKLFIGVPNIASLNAKVFGRYWWYLGAPVHTFNYSVKTLSALLEKSGFRIERVRFNSDFGGVLGSYQIFLNRRSNRRSLDGLPINSQLMRVSAHWLAKLIDGCHLGDAVEFTCSKS
nr:hypothetical protein Hi04_10k_c4773_00035 [uncultured bacterium]